MNYWVVSRSYCKSQALLYVLGLLLLALWATSVRAESDTLEFRHGISQIPNYQLKYPPDFTHFDHVNADAPKGGTLVLPYTYSLNTVSPAYKPPGFIRSYDHLLERAGDEPSGYYASLAESVAITTDRRSIVFKLRPEARWHDGTPITAVDVSFSLNTYRTDIMATGWAPVLSWITGIDELDPLTIAIHGDSDVAKQMRIISYIPIIPAHYWQTRDVTIPTMELPPQSGPYRLTTASPTKYFIYTRVPDYWGRELPVNRGKFNFDTIRYERYLDATVAREALRAGNIDVWRETDSRHWLASYDVPASERGWLIKGTLASGALRGSRFRLVLNTRRQPFDNPLVREALAYAFDFEWQNRALHGGELKRADSFFANSMFASSGLPDDAELELLEPHRKHLPADVFDRVFSYPSSDGIGVDRQGLYKARQLLKNAGYRITDGVVTSAEGIPLSIEFLSDSPTSHRILLPYAGALSMLGIQADIRMVESTRYTNRRREGDFDAILVSGYFEAPPSWQLRPYFHSGSTPYWNPSGVNHPTVDALVDTALGATDPDSFFIAVRALDRVLLWNYYQFPLEILGDIRIVYWDKFGRPVVPDDMYVTPFPDGWWFDEEKAARIGAER